MARNQQNGHQTSVEKASDHINLMPLLEAMFREFQEASKRKPEASVNKAKIAIVNRLLKDVLTVVDGEPTRTYLDLLDEDAVPQNSDVVLILGQAVAAMNAFKNKYYRHDAASHQRIWAIAEAAKKR